MMKVKIACDECGVEMAADEAYWDAGMERDLCPEHFIMSELSCAIAERKKYATWLESVHLKKLRELDAKIAKLEQDLETLERPASSA